MDAIIALIYQLLPLYGIAALGFVAGKSFKSIDHASIATLVMFTIAPVVFTLSISQINFSKEAVLIAVIIFLIASLLGIITLSVSKLFLKEKSPYLAALASSTNNWGYFGLPIAFALFEPQTVAIFIMIGFGTQIFDNSLGMYFASRGKFSPKDSLKNIARYPVIYSIAIGLILSYLNFDLPKHGEDFLQLFKGAYTVLGMMIIGLGLSSLKKFNLDVPFLTTIFLLKCTVWPAIATGLIMIDQHIQFFGPDFYKPLLLFSIMPMAANNIAYATKFNTHPGKASIAVVLTTLFAIIYVPFMIEFLDIR